MSNTPIYVGSSSTKRERRQQRRATPTALLYIHIGADNGGIVTDLTDDGVRVRAVHPLDLQTETAVGLQLPNSHARIDTAARIVWVSESKKEGGLHFVVLSAEERSQIRSWILSDTSPNEAPVTQVPAHQSERAERAASYLRKDRWRSLLVESEHPDDRTTTSSIEVGDASTIRDKQSYRDAPAQSNPSHRDATRSEDALATKEIPRTPAFHVSPIRPARETADESKADLDSLFSHIRWPASLSPVQTDHEEPAFASAPVQVSPEPRSPVLKLENVQPIAPSGTSSVAVAANPKRRTLNWLEVAGMVALLVALFLVGRWAGLRHHTAKPSAQLSGAPPVVVHLAKSAENAQPLPAENRVGPLVVRHFRPKDPQKLVSRNRTSGGSLSPSLARVSNTAPLVSDTMPPPTIPRSALALPKPPPSEPAEHIFVAAPTVRKPAEVQKPIVVNGHRLGPTDRYNPAHLTYRFDPAYPAAAKKQHIAGVVELQLVIGADGAVRNVEVIDGQAPLVSAAVAAAENWRFLPALLNGQPVQSKKDVQIKFRPSPSH